MKVKKRNSWGARPLYVKCPRFQDSLITTTVRVNRPHEHIPANIPNFDASVRRSVTILISICQVLMLVAGELVASFSCDAVMSSFTLG